MKEKRPYLEMIAAANVVKEKLESHCFRIEIGGSLRRGCDFISDIELIAIPKPYQDGLFEDGLAAVVNQWEKVKGEMVYGKTKYTQRILPSGIKLDLFFAEENNFGNILLIRTGDWQFSKVMMGVCLPKKGYKSEDGWLTYNGRAIATPEEINIFERAGIPYIEPKDRDINALK